ncbi:patched domain-containing protein 3 isoform X2 [Gouania willdenowi]|uniref:patched domain-containing protein 3 isoform X2 n=1 Tax=Gouania willdenowi TaxID=441366 RepID=UPI001054A2D6|nr:patched domain-containing protein 3 isoform X2 [Gouania willdenowi]
MGWMRIGCLSRPLPGLFAKLGFTIGSYPSGFFIIPLLVTAVLGGGFVFLHERQDNDLERQFTPIKGPSKAARDFVRENFPYDDSMFSEDRLYGRGYFASFIAVSTSGRNVLEEHVYQDIFRLNNRILNIKVSNQTLGLNELCAKVDGKCFTNAILEMMSSNETVINYPMQTYGSTLVFMGSVLGGVVTDANSIVKSAQAVKLFYYLEDQESMAEDLRSWLRRFKELMMDSTNETNIDVSYYTSKSKQGEIDSHTTDGFPLFLITYACAIGFSVISCLRADNVRNKVWVAVFGVLSAGLAVLSSFGFLLYIGVPFVITVANSPFIILGPC